MLKLGKQSLTGNDSQTMLHLENEGQSFEIVLGGLIPLLGVNGMSWETAERQSRIIVISIVIEHFIEPRTKVKVAQLLASVASGRLS